jgi:hypothetical protein
MMTLIPAGGFCGAEGGIRSVPIDQMTCIILDKMLHAYILRLHLGKSEENPSVATHVSFFHERLFHARSAAFCDAVSGVALEDNKVCLPHSRCSKP